MPETPTERLAAIVGLLVALALLAAGLSARNERPAVAQLQTDPLATPTQELITTVATRSATKRPAPAKAARLVLRAARGDCWLSVRAGTSDGAILYEGVLVSGRTLRVQRARLWVRLGAAANVDATLNGRPVTAFATGTLDVVVTPAGIRPA